MNGKKILTLKRYWRQKDTLPIIEPLPLDHEVTRVIRHLALAIPAKHTQEEKKENRKKTNQQQNPAISKRNHHSTKRSPCTRKELKN